MEGIGHRGRSQTPHPHSLELALRPALEIAAGRRFECPDCDGDPRCITCGEPTRRGVLDWLQARLLEAVA